jgi:dTDP-4-amino-4,6-dideoxygalactose transaminase
VLGSASETEVAVPFLDLRTVHDDLADAILQDFAALIETGAFRNGPAVAEFERAFAEFCGQPHCVGLSSGLDALRLGLIAAGLQAGDRVVVPAHTFIATFEAVTQAGGVPLPVDVTESDYNLDPGAAEAAVDERVRFVLPVHLYGQLADMRSLGEIAAKHRLTIIEDACQAHGADRDGLFAGTVGLANAFSFYPGKNLGAMGDAGALVTRSETVAETVRALREHGQTAKYKHELEGWTARLDTIQAIVLLHKLPLLEGWNNERRQVAVLYTEALADIGDLRTPSVPPESHPVWHLYVVRTKRRDELAAFLRTRGIDTGVHYPEPPHLAAPYAHLGYARGSFPIAEALAEEVLSLPIFPGMTEGQIMAVTDSIVAFFQDG